MYIILSAKMIEKKLPLKVSREDETVEEADEADSRLIGVLEKGKCACR
jgi:hypothetical protein